MQRYLHVYFARYRDIKPERSRDCDLELLGSCDVIGHVTGQYPILAYTT